MACLFAAAVLLLPQPHSPSVFMAAAEDTPCVDDTDLCNDPEKCTGEMFGVIYQTLCPIMCGICAGSKAATTTTDVPSFNTAETPSVTLGWGITVTEAEASATISVGDVVMWTLDQDDQPHNIKSGTNSEPFPESDFNSRMLQAGETFSFQFKEAGTFPYFCSPHPWMVGTITVVAPTETTTTISTTTTTTTDQCGSGVYVFYILHKPHRWPSG